MCIGETTVKTIEQSAASKLLACHGEVIDDFQFWIEYDLSGNAIYQILERDESGYFFDSVVLTVSRDQMIAFIDSLYY